MRKIIGLLLIIVLLVMLLSNGNTKALLLATELPIGTSSSQVYANLYEYLACLGYAEWRGEDFEGQISGFAVLINRVQHSDFPDTYYDVITEDNPRQFTPVRSDGLIYANKSVVTFDMVPQKTLDALDRALAGEDPTEMLLEKETERLLAEGSKLKLEPSAYYQGGAVFFMTEKAFQNFKDGVAVYVTIDHHVFFRAWSL